MVPSKQMQRANSVTCSSQLEPTRSVSGLFVSSCSSTSHSSMLLSLSIFQNPPIQHGACEIEYETLECFVQQFLQLTVSKILGYFRIEKISATLFGSILQASESICAPITPIKSRCIISYSVIHHLPALIPERWKNQRSGGSILLLYNLNSFYSFRYCPISKSYGPTVPIPRWAVIGLQTEYKLP